MNVKTTSGKTRGKVLMLAGLGMELLAIGLLIRGIATRQSNVPIAIVSLIIGISLLFPGRNMMKSQ